MYDSILHRNVKGLAGVAEVQGWPLPNLVLEVRWEWIYVALITDIIYIIEFIESKETVIFLLTILHTQILFFFFKDIIFSEELIILYSIVSIRGTV